MAKKKKKGRKVDPEVALGFIAENYGSLQQNQKRFNELSERLRMQRRGITQSTDNQEKLRLQVLIDEAEDRIKAVAAGLFRQHGGNKTIMPGITVREPIRMEVLDEAELIEWADENLPLAVQRIVELDEDLIFQTLKALDPEDIPDCVRVFKDIEVRVGNLARFLED